MNAGLTARGVRPRHDGRFRRRALRLFVGHLLLAAVTLIVLLVGITDANAGYPALFFAGILAAVSLPVWVITSVFAAISLARREPRPAIAGGLLAISGLLSLAVAPIAFGILKGVLATIG